MNRQCRVGLWWPPLLLALLPAFGLAPGHRDLIDFFAPIRATTAAALADGTIPWLNLANGCGEAWFANPETAVLYPPAWLHLLLPPAWALSLEIGLHLAWLSLGIGLLARHLGASWRGQAVAEVAAWTVGPVVFTVGVLNNLETLAWVPWMVLAARRSARGSTVLLAGATALAWLGGEPQVWALGVAVTVLAARSRARAAAGVGLGLLLVCIQLVPFVFWVLEGDRGPVAAAWVLEGALVPGDLTGLLAPGLAFDAQRMVYVESLFVGAPLMLCGLLGGRRLPWVLLLAGLLLGLAILPSVGGGGLLLALTAGLVRYPSRFAVFGLALLLPMVARGADDWMDGRGRALAAGLGLLTLALCVAGGQPQQWFVAGIPSALMLAGAARLEWRTVRAAALVAGVAACAAAAVPLLGLQASSAVAADHDTWPEAEAGGGRLYAPAPSIATVPWLAQGMAARRLWPVGYLNLDDGLRLVRTDAPVMHRRLAEHLAIADEGAARRWWVDAASARWVVLRDAAPIPAGMERVRVRGGMQLLHNHRALDEVTLAADRPEADLRPPAVGNVRSSSLEGNSCEAILEAKSAGWVWLSVAPIRGWRWFLDEIEVSPEQGPGIVQYLAVTSGRHVLKGHYQPPFLLASASGSGVAVVILVMLLWRGRRGLVGPEPSSSSAPPRISV